MTDSAPPLRLHPDLAGPAPAEITIEGLAEAKPPRSRAAPALPAAVEKELLTAKEAGQMCGRSAASWWRDHAAARVPAPVRLGGATRWRARELRAWIDKGCPDRRTWETMEKARKPGR